MELYIFCVEFGVDVRSYTNAPGNSFASSIMRLQDQTVWSSRQFRPRYMFHIAYVNFPYIHQQNNHNHFVLLKTRHDKLTFHTMSNTANAKTSVSELLSVSVPRGGFSAMLQEQYQLLRRIPPPAPHTHERRRGEKGGVSKQGKPSQADRTRLTKRKHPHGQADRAGVKKRKDQQGRIISDNEKRAENKKKLRKRKASQGAGIPDDVETKSQKLKRRKDEQKAEKKCTSRRTHAVTKSQGNCSREGYEAVREQETDEHSAKQGNCRGEGSEAVR